MKILHISANPKPVNEANSKQLTEEFFRVLQEQGSDIDITHIDLYDSPPPFFNFQVYRNFWYPIFDPDYKPTEEEKEASRYAFEQMEIFNNTDILVITTPMWNFSVPAILKAWEDMVLNPGGVFTIGPGGMKPKHHVKKVIILMSSAGAYSGDYEWMNALIPQIRAAFGYVGIKDIEYAWADGTNSFAFKDSKERKQKAMEKAGEMARKVVSMNKAVAK